MSVAQTRLMTRTNSVGERNIIKHSRIFFGSGGAAASAPRYHHTQTVASVTWTIAHNLGYLPVIQFFDNGNIEFDCYCENGTLVSTGRMSAAIAGYAECR